MKVSTITAKKCVIMRTAFAPCIKCGESTMEETHCIQANLGGLELRCGRCCSECNPEKHTPLLGESKDESCDFLMVGPGKNVAPARRFKRPGDPAGMRKPLGH